jgi:signal peptide peptidase SppA
MMPGALVHIADRLYGRPLFIHPQKAELIGAIIGQRFGANVTIDVPEGAIPGGGVDASRFTGSRLQPDGNVTLFRKEGGTAIISVVGSLVNRGAWLDASSGMTSYEGIAAQLKAAASDPSVKSILLDIDSPGGEATGMFSLASAIQSARKSKRVVASVNDMAASAAYGIASAADEIVISPTSIVGSVGVVMLHLDRSAEMAQKGIRATLIHAGAHKVDGHPFGPLSAEVAADLQRDVMTFYDRFLDTVAEGRKGKMTRKQARDTEARTFIGEEAIKLGLADRVASFDETLARLSTTTTTTARPGAARSKLGASKMDEDMIARADHDKAVKAAREDGFNAGKAEGEKAGHAAGMAAERERAKAILTLDEAKGREAQASALVAAGVEPSAAKDILLASPQGNSLAARMTEAQTTSPGAPQGQPEKQSPSASWDKFVDRANARVR